MKCYITSRLSLTFTVFIKVSNLINFQFYMFFNFNSQYLLLNVQKEINSLISKMSNIYLEVTIEKKRGTQNFDFVSLKSSFPGQFLGSTNSLRYH